jgi:hypothetical protein
MSASMTGCYSADVGTAQDATQAAEMSFARARPGEPGWPSEAQWNGLSNLVGGRLIKIEDPLAECRHAPAGSACQAFFKEMRNPYFPRKTLNDSKRR